MRKVISEFSVGSFKVLVLDAKKPVKYHTKYLIDGKEYKIVPMYDADNCIAIKATDSLVGKIVEFV